MLLKELCKPPPQNLPAPCLGKGVYEMAPILEVLFKKKLKQTWVEYLDLPL